LATAATGGSEKVPIHGGTGYPQHLGDVDGCDSLVPQAANLGGIGVINLSVGDA
jgi:hypothetical protein